MRVGVVNDLSLALRILTRVVEEEPWLEVAWTAENGEEALKKCRRDTPDVILMDLVMPVMDGVEATRRIMEECPCAVLVVTATVEGNKAKVFRAMGFGALDAATTPTMGEGGRIEGGRELVDKLHTLATIIGREVTEKEKAHPRSDPVPAVDVPLVAVGASTGGPTALATFLEGLPEDFPGTVAIVQHVDARFAEGLAEWLDHKTPLAVSRARAGDRIQPGRVYVAGGEKHLVMETSSVLGLAATPLDIPYRPSVDVFFESLAKSGRRPACAVLLTGMGKDGARGMLALRKLGWWTVAQDEATSVVWGMPKAAVELEAANKVLPLEKIAPAVADRIRRHYWNETNRESDS